MADPRPRGVIESIVATFLDGKQAILLLIFALCLGATAVLVTPREEEPQIVVPMADIMVQVPGASAEEVEKLVTAPLERILWQIDGVEYVYANARRDMAMATVRFFVGEDRERSLIKLHNAITTNQDLVPDIVTGWAVKPREVDDVPILLLTFYSDTYDDYALRRIAEEFYHRLAEEEDISRLELVGGRSREVRVDLSPERLAGFNISAQDVVRALGGADASVTAGTATLDNETFSVTSDSFLMEPGELGSLVVGVFEDKPVSLSDVAEIRDGPEEPSAYSRLGFSYHHARQRAELGILPGQAASATGDAQRLSDELAFPAVTLAIAKKKGTNAVNVARRVVDRSESLIHLLPDGVRVEITRDYGKTAQSKVNELLTSLFFAIVTVVVLLAIALGRREALVVAVSVPVSFALALFVSMLLGYTINRVTLFALILSLGLVVDDPIMNVDNIQRHILMRRQNPFRATLTAVREVLPPVLLSTLAIIVSFAPMFFITGMMGPYMAPMAANVPLAVIFSTLAALTVVPWLSYHLIKRRVEKGTAPAASTTPTMEDATQFEDTTPAWVRSTYRRLLGPFLASRGMRVGLLVAVLALLAGSLALAGLRYVPLKMLPYDNKDELQLVIDLPEGSSLEDTDRVVRVFEEYLRTVPEVTTYVTYTGDSSPIDFNGLVRQYYLREEPHQADVRINLAAKDDRVMQSHDIVLRLRGDLEAIAEREGATLKIVESPPGPPVVATLTAEISGRPDTPYEDIIAAAKELMAMMEEEPGVTDIDASFEDPSRRLNFVVDKQKAALHGVTTEAITETLRIAVGGAAPATIHLPDERQPLYIRVILPRELRVSEANLTRIPVRTESGAMIELGELGAFEVLAEDQPIFHKNLNRVVWVFAEMAGRPPGEAVLDLDSRLKQEPLPPGIRVDWASEGEWKITLRVFRDLGLAFGAALVSIYILLVLQTNSFSMPLLLMTAIPLTLLGIMPGFWLMNVFFTSSIGGYTNNVFFTATSMIGMIALGGIVIRNSLVLLEFIEESRAQGMDVKEAILESGAVRFRPIVLTALTTALGAWPITLDPIFSGLAWALIFGLVASTAFTLLVVPVGYYVTRGRKPMQV
ncbi:AcrB/AcrD/AcrF family protein [Oceanidesulfovibrio indonesiensis]|uniref:AcrB/AcrD/AcrF family protein n=1 Tax=Oceanidesulfovibrio indonesiensis TaxID=54767 RepID=A0A7M3MED4_9BACT|nr:efflux RND transporter permease subunit [Oceanidesulfovibrio indonesiensis]TVM17188.1 AcrB/AcrD/AcrF family protein [Oceanidesulfovibrio indonesiensis]